MTVDRNRFSFNLLISPSVTSTEEKCRALNSLGASKPSLQVTKKGRLQSPIAQNKGVKGEDG